MKSDIARPDPKIFLRIGFGGDSNNFETCLSIFSDYLNKNFRIN